jgi:hypothetical protein
VAIEVRCPQCHTKLKTPDSFAGKKARCPKCTGVVEIPAGASGEEEILEPEIADPLRGFNDDELEVEPPPSRPAADESRRPCPMCGEMIAAKAVKCRFCGEILDKSMRGALAGAGHGDFSDPGWQTVRAGLGMMYYSIVTIVVCVILVILGAVITGAMAGPGADREPPAALMILLIPIGLAVLIAGFAVLIGQARCASVPQQSGARGVAQGSAVCLVGYILLSMVGGAMQNPALSAVGGLLSLIGTVLFILFIRRSAAYLGNDELATSAARYLIFCVGFIAGCFVLGFMAGAAGAGGEPFGLILGIVLLVCGIAAFIWYLRLIRTLMTTVEERTGAG